MAVASWVTPGQAHKPSDSYVSLSVGETGEIAGRWDLALRDLDHAVGLDGNDDGTLSWGELKARHGAIADYALARLSLAVGERRCMLHPSEHLVDEHSDGTYAVMRFRAGCAAGSGQPIDIRYDMLFDLDPQHRGLLKVERGGRISTTVLGPERREWRVEAGRPAIGKQFLTYLGEGIRHIALGLDHLLFLICLLLPAVVRWKAGRWQPVGRFRDAAVEVVKVISAFTVAHSMTLGLATFGWINLDPRVVEPLIAASIIFAAFNNLYPVVTRGLWAVAFGFGLLHGIGFAGALVDLGLPRDALLLPLLAFNLGVEVGQLAIVGTVLPVAFLLRNTSLYRWVGVQVGSILIAATASLWLLEAAIGLSLLT